MSRLLESANVTLIKGEKSSRVSYQDLSLSSEKGNVLKIILSLRSFIFPMGITHEEADILRVLQRKHAADKF